MRQILNYSGGKARLATWIVQHLPEHQVYCEPFGGSAAILLAKEPSRLEIYNDLDGELVNFFETLAHRPKALIKALEHTLYARIHATNGTKKSISQIERARRFFARNATTWFVGGTFKTQRRAQKRTVIDVFEKRKATLPLVAARLKRVIFEHLDALALIKKYDGPDVLFYCDPPYLGARKSDLYAHEMMDETAHRELARALHECQGAAVLSGYPSALYKELYGDWSVMIRHGQTNAKDFRQECLWIKTAQNGEVRRSQLKAISPRSLREILRETSRHILSQASRNPHNGERYRIERKPKWNTALSEAFQKTEDGLSFGEIVRTLQIPGSTLCRYLRRWKSQGLIRKDSVTELWSAAIAPVFEAPVGAVRGVAERAKTNRISVRSQELLDYIARRRPEILKEIADGKLSIRAAYNQCRPTKSDNSVRKLRSAWKRATERERELFRAEIDAQLDSTRDEPTKS